MQPALLVIDVQKQFYRDENTAKSLAEAVDCINAAVDLFRAKDLPVIVVQHKDEASGLVPGSDGFELPEALRILPTDRRIVKTRGSAFAQTGLAEDLRSMGVDTLILAGYCAEYCVLSTCRWAKDLDFRPIILRGGLASHSPEHIRFVEEINDIISYGALQAVLE